MRAETLQLTMNKRNKRKCGRGVESIKGIIYINR